MKKVLIIVNAEVNEQGKITSGSPVTEKMVAAIKQGIATNSEPVTVEVVAAGNLWSKVIRRDSSVSSQVQLSESESNSISSKSNKAELIYCPLTIQLPDYFDFPSKKIYSSCRDIIGRRRWVEANLGYKTSVGDSWLGHLWLPVVVTNQVPLYGEVIGEGAIPNSYEQPIDLPNRLRKSLYHLANKLLKSLSATPAVYLIQFSIHNNEIIFDRLWPFPAAPALGSLRNQYPDLYTCHWYCLTNQPLLDLAISEEIMPI
jgi:hypothetical protein